MKFLYADITPEENERRKQALADTLVETFGFVLEDPEFIARCEAAGADESADAARPSRRRRTAGTAGDSTTRSEVTP